MSVITYSLKTDGTKKLSKNFTVKEFACKDGSDAVLIDTTLVEVLQAIRDHFGKPVRINSAYRTPAYNITVGGSSKSQHCLGAAADIRIVGIDPLNIALYVSSLPQFKGRGGIGYYSRTNLKDGFVHVDVRKPVSRWISKTGTTYLTVSNIMPTIKMGARDATNGLSYSVTVLQRHLGITADGIFGEKTRQKLVEWQKEKGLTPDGIAGAKTWNAM